MSNYVYNLKTLYEAQEKRSESITYKVLFENQCLEGFVVGVDCRTDTFELEIPGEYESGKLDIWKIQEISEGRYMEIPLTIFGELTFSIPYSYWAFMCQFRFFSYKPSAEDWRVEFVCGTWITPEKREAWPQARQRFLDYIDDLSSIMMEDKVRNYLGFLLRDEQSQEYNAIDNTGGKA